MKPANVLIREDGSPVLTDFGIAALGELSTLTTTGALIGSPEYIAPERLRNQEGDPASDLWSLGMLLYVAVEGAHPLRRGTALATLTAVLEESVPAPTRAGALAPVLVALLDRDPAVRPDAARLDRLLAEVEAAEAETPEDVAPKGETPEDAEPSPSAAVDPDADTATAAPPRPDPKQTLPPRQDPGRSSRRTGADQCRGGLFARLGGQDPGPGRLGRRHGPAEAGAGRLLLHA